MKLQPRPFEHSSDLYVIQVAPALGDGGVEQSTLEMATYLNHKNVFNAAATSGGKHAEKLAHMGTRMIYGSFKSKGLGALIKNSLILQREVEGHACVILHARSRAPAWSAWLAARFSGALFITTFHGTYGLRGGWLKRFYNSVMLRGPLVIANSAFTKQHIIDNYNFPSENIVVASRGIEPDVFDPGRFSESDRKRLRLGLGVKETDTVLMLVGRFSRWKGHDLLVSSLNKLKNIEDWKLVFVGGPEKNGAYYEDVKNLVARLGLGDRVVFAGSRSDVPACLAVADIALSCSTRPEAFGRVAVEAMAMEVPVIATALGGSLETVKDGETGFLVQPDGDGVIQPQRLEETLREALRDRARLVRMGKAARAHVLEHFTVEACCRAEFSAYERLLALKNKNK